MRGLTSEELVQRATAREAERRRGRATQWLFVALCTFTVAIAWLSPLRPFFWHHREFWWGVLAGSVAEALVVLSRRWFVDRWLWLRWFNRMS